MAHKLIMTFFHYLFTYGLLEIVNYFHMILLYFIVSALLTVLDVHDRPKSLFRGGLVWYEARLIKFSEKV